MKSLEFTGNGTEYFKIWIVNILLTIVTLGFYHPWARVRTSRYFFGNTHLDNSNFEYHATGKQLFIGFLISMGLLIIYLVLSQFSPVLGAILAIAIFLASPWIIWRSIKFNLRMISYRNVRFGFDGSLKGSYVTFLAYPMAMLIGFGIVIAIVMGVLSQVLAGGAVVVAGFMFLFFYPAFLAMFNKISSNYLTNGAHFGQGSFTADLKFKPFFMIMLKGIGLGVLLAFLTLAIIGLLAYFTVGFGEITHLAEQMSNVEAAVDPGAIMFVFIGLVYLLFIVLGIYVAAYLKARHRTYLFNETTLDNAINFDSALQADKLFGIHLGNLLMMIFTLGLAYPWAKVRAYRYLTETIQVDAKDGFDGYMSQQGGEGALGEELGEAFDIDVGGIAF
jgi:uncharacterized membrane protein YjgN (DUF898 family)